jgi:hypothetical protein
LPHLPLRVRVVRQTRSGAFAQCALFAGRLVNGHIAGNQEVWATVWSWPISTIGAALMCRTSRMSVAVFIGLSLLAAAAPLPAHSRLRRAAANLRWLSGSNAGVRQRCGTLLCGLESEDAVEANAIEMETLFAQLGLPDDASAIARFIHLHGPLGGGIGLHEAEFWTPAQARFLREAIVEDAEWAEIVDRLNAELHRRNGAS